MKQSFYTITTIIFFITAPLCSKSQEFSSDSLWNIVNTSKEDSILYKSYRALYEGYEESTRDTAIYTIEKALQLARRNKKELAIAASVTRLGYQLLQKGRYSESLECILESFRILENPSSASNEWLTTPLATPEMNRILAIAHSHHMYGVLMARTMNIEMEIFHFREAKRLAQQINNTQRILLADMNLARAYTEINNLDSAIFFANEAESLAQKINHKRYLSTIYFFYAQSYHKKGDWQKAAKFYYKSIETGIAFNNLSGLARSINELSKYYIKVGNVDSAFYYSSRNLEVVSRLGTVTAETNLGKAYEGLYGAYLLKNQKDSALKYAKLALAYNDSLSKVRLKNLADFQNLSLREQVRLKNLEKEKVIYQNKIRTWSLIAGLGTFLLLALILYRNNRQKQRSNKVLEKTLTDLKSTQAQLIHSEKMASLGELTAGIAHEIQNPLNFVNNFSEINTELVQELKDEIANGKFENVNGIADDIAANEEKINFHGKRADAIVKGMLQHSRSSSGQKEPTDINALADEYLRLAYHGLRAKDKTFNATLKTSYDETLGNISIVPQDIGRVILNLITNAFYAVTEKKKMTDGKYEPIVSVTTIKKNGFAEIHVKDNGNGIPKQVRDKIFQPFFTTKPTGQGTGLGLSLSYDIIKAHGGNINVETKEGEWTEFMLALPVKQ